MARRDRRRHLPRHLRRPRRAARRRGLRRRAGPLWHEDADLRGVDGVFLPGRLLVRRLPALRRHRLAVAGDGRGRRASPPAAAPCSASATASRCSARRACCPACCAATTAAASSAARPSSWSSAPSPWTGSRAAGDTLRSRSSTTRAPGTCSTTRPSRLAADGQVLLRYARRRQRRHGAGGGRLQRGRQRVRPDAAPRARGRRADRLDRRPRRRRRPARDRRRPRLTFKPAGRPADARTVTDHAHLRLVPDRSAEDIARAVALIAGVREGHPPTHVERVGRAGRRDRRARRAWTTQTASRCIVGAWLHDVGMVALPDSVLCAGRPRRRRRLAARPRPRHLRRRPRQPRPGARAGRRRDPPPPRAA